MYDQVFIEDNENKVGINPQGGYVTSWKIKDTQILYQGSTIRRTGIPILFPYYGKSHRMRIHGFGRDCLWAITAQDPKALTMELTPNSLTQEDRRDYPFEFNAQITVKVEGESQLVYSLVVSNHGPTDLPISPGIHPYWAIPHEQKKNSTFEGLASFSAESVDWDTAPPDTPLYFTGNASVHFLNRTLTIQEQSLPRVVKFLQLWSQTPLRDPDYNFVCVEPICGRNYEIDESPLLVKPGESWEMKVCFTITGV